MALTEACRILEGEKGTNYWEHNLILVHRSVVEIIYLLLGRNISFPTYL